MVADQIYHVVKIMFLSTLLSGHEVKSFTIQSCPLFQARNTIIQNEYRETSLSYSMLDEVTNQFSSLSYHFSTIPNIPISLEAKSLVSQAASSMQMNDNPTLFEGMFLSDVSRVVLDLSIFVIRTENPSLLYLATVVGKIVGMLSDYIPDHDVRPDELIFQISMITVYSYLLMESVIPSARVFLSKQRSLPDRRDVIAYRHLFEPAGFTWMQLKTLFACEALEWVEIAPGNTSQFRNQITKASKNSMDDQRVDVHWIYNKTNKSFETSDDIGLFACTQFLRKLEKRKKNSKRTRTKPKIVTENNFDQSLSRYEQKVAKGATILQINSEKMIEMMEKHEGLSTAMLFLTVNCLEISIRDNAEHISDQYASFQNQPPHFYTPAYQESSAMSSDATYLVGSTQA